MSEIPDDIFAAARMLADHAQYISCEQSALNIARALYAERERCANVAEGIGSIGRDWALTSFMGNLRRDIADAIRATPVSEREEPQG